MHSGFFLSVVCVKKKIKKSKTDPVAMNVNLVYFSSLKSKANDFLRFNTCLRYGYIGPAAGINP